MSGLDSPLLWLAIACVFVFAGFVKGVIGVGLPTIVMGLLGAVMPPAQAASLMVLPTVVTNIWQVVAGPGFFALVRRLWPMLAGICVGTWAGAGLLTGGNAEHTRLALGVILALYGCTGFTTMRFTVSRGAERWLSPVIGLITGLLTGATGVSVIPAVPYIHSLGSSREELIQALALSPLVAALALGVSLASGGVLGLSLTGVSSLAMVPALLGMYLGQCLRLRVSEAVFRRVFFAGLVALGGYLALRSL
jgi:uncharacterized membrane protein YfcA